MVRSISAPVNALGKLCASPWLRQFGRALTIGLASAALVFATSAGFAGNSSKNGNNNQPAAKKATSAPATRVDVVKPDLSKKGNPQKTQDLAAPKKALDPVDQLRKKGQPVPTKKGQPRITHMPGDAQARHQDFASFAGIAEAKEDGVMVKTLSDGRKIVSRPRDTDKYGIGGTIEVQSPSGKIKEKFRYR